MSASKSVPKGLKNQECEKGNQKKRPPIPYVPIVDEVQEAIAKGKNTPTRLNSSTRPSLVYPSETLGSRVAFLIHVQQAKSVCKRKGLFQVYYDDAIEA